MPKEGLQLSFHQLYYFIIITKYHQKIISHSEGYPGLSPYRSMSKTCQNSYGKIQITYKHKKTFLSFNGTFL